MRYFYCPCDAGLQVNPGFRFYFRLFKEEAGKAAILVDQGLADLIDGWTSKYKAVIQTENPYARLD